MVLSLSYAKNIETSVTTITADLELTPVRDVVKLADLGIIYFDFDKHNIRPDAALQLDKIVNAISVMVNNQCI